MAGRTPNCSCGCGEPVRLPEHRYLRGHNSRINNPMKNPVIAARHRHSPEASEKKRRAWLGENNPMHQQASRVKVFTAVRGAKISRANWRGGSHSHYERTARRAAEVCLGRPLRLTSKRMGCTEIVHHINFDRSDNRPCNLAVMTHSMHQRLHGRIKRRRASQYFKSRAADLSLGLRCWMEANW